MSDSVQAARRRARFPVWLRVILGVIVVGATFYFLIGRLVADWNKVPWQDIHLNVPLLVIAFIVLLLGYIPVFGLTWKVLLAGLGAKLPAVKAIAIIAVSQLGKYVPGKVWFTLGRIYLAKRHGIPESKSAVSAFMEIGFALLTALMLFAVSLLFLPAGRAPAQAYLAFVLVPLCLLIIYPPLLRRIVNFILRRLRQPAIDIRLSFGRIAALVGLYLSMWLAQGLGFFILINSFYRIPMAELPVVVGGYALAWILGFLVLISPAGLGVREGIMTFALRLIMPEPVAIIAALLGRVWITVAEVLAAGIMAFFLGSKDSTRRNTGPAGRSRRRETEVR